MTKISDITIESLGARGDGIGRLPDGRRVFVPGVLPGEVVSVTLGEARDRILGLTSAARDPEAAEPALPAWGVAAQSPTDHADAALSGT